MWLATDNPDTTFRRRNIIPFFFFFGKATFRYPQSQKTARTLWPRRLTQLSIRNDQRHTAFILRLQQTHGQEQLTGGKDLLVLYFQVSQYLREVREEPKQELEEAGTIKGMFLAGLLILRTAKFPYTVQDHLSREQYYPQWAGPPTSVSHQDNPPYAYSQASLIWATPKLGQADS